MDMLKTTVGYIRRTANEGLLMLYDSRDHLDHMYVTVFTDADLATPRSQSSMMFGICSDTGRSWLPADPNRAGSGCG